jgi:hypothetical protein
VSDPKESIPVARLACGIIYDYASSCISHVARDGYASYIMSNGTEKNDCMY